MASAEHEPITGVWGQSPQRGPGAEPPAGSRGRAPGQGVRGRSPPEAESILVIGCPTEPANLAPLQKCLALQGMNGLTVDLSALRKPVRTIETQLRQYHVTKVGGLVI